MSQDDQAISRAIEASLNETYTVEEEAPRVPDEFLLRKDNRWDIL
jgi:hypothetical protein